MLVLPKDFSEANGIPNHYARPTSSRSEESLRCQRWNWVFSDQPIHDRQNELLHNGLSLHTQQEIAELTSHLPSQSQPVLSHHHALAAASRAQAAQRILRQGHSLRSSGPRPSPSPSVRWAHWLTTLEHKAWLNMWTNLQQLCFEWMLSFIFGLIGIKWKASLNRWFSFIQLADDTCLLVFVLLQECCFRSSQARLYR